MDKQKLHDLVYSYKTKNFYGFSFAEIEEIKESFPNLNEEKFTQAMRGHTGMIKDGVFITYKNDVYYSLLAAIEIEIDEKRLFNLRK